MAKLFKMNRYSAILYQDLKRYFKYMKRDIFVNIMVRPNKKGPFPKGKHPSYKYESLLDTLFMRLKKKAYKKLWFNSDIRDKHTTVPWMIMHNPKYDPKNKLLVHTNVTFRMFCDMLISDNGAHAWLRKLDTCYKIAGEAMDFVNTSNHMDVEIRCGHQYRSCLLMVFDRFGLNRKCIKAGDKYKAPELHIIMAKNEDYHDI